MWRIEKNGEATIKASEELINEEIGYQYLTKELNSPEVAREHAKQFLIKICIDSVMSAKEKGKCRCNVDIFDCKQEHVEFVRELLKKKEYITRIDDFGTPHKYLNIDWN